MNPQWWSAFAVGATVGIGTVVVAVHIVGRTCSKAVAKNMDTIGRLRADTHALATWLMLARERIREAEQLLADQTGIGVDMWRKRIRDTVWEIQFMTDITARSQSDGEGNAT